MHCRHSISGNTMHTLPLWPYSTHTLVCTTQSTHSHSAYSANILMFVGHSPKCSVLTSTLTIQCAHFCSDRAAKSSAQTMQRTQSYMSLTEHTFPSDHLTFARTIRIPERTPGPNPAVGILLLGHKSAHTTVIHLTDTPLLKPSCRHEESKATFEIWIQ